MDKLTLTAQKMVALSLRLSVAESCTGGVLSSILTTVPGASSWFVEGLVCYSFQSKSGRLGLSPDFLNAHGLVSQKVSEAMARQIALTSNSDIGIGITGNAGPDNITGRSLSGVVFVSLYAQNFANTERYHFHDSRLIIQEKAARAALGILFDYLTKEKADR